MEKLSFINKASEEVNYLKFEVKDAKCSVVIAHGMAEHPYRYAHLASYLNENGINVYAIFHIGHGECASKLAHMDKGDFDRCISNVSQLVDFARNENQHKVFLLGHSMGSFMSQLYITRYKNIDGVILSGSTASSAFLSVGAFIAKVIGAFNKDKTKPSKFLDNVAFGSYNKKYENPKTKFDWLTNDENIVNQYIEDKYCGWVGSIGFFMNMTNAMAQMGKKKNIKNVDKNLPILIVGGKCDPVSNFEKGLINLEKQYKKLEIKDVTLIMYDNFRHEIYNEINKEKAYEDTLRFISKHL